MDHSNTSLTQKRKAKTALTLSKKSKRYRINRTSTPLPEPSLTSDSEFDSDSVNSESGVLCTANNNNRSNENLVIPSTCGPRKDKAVQVSVRVKNISSQTRHKVARQKSTQTYFTTAKPRISPIRKDRNIVPQRRKQQHVDTNASRLFARLRRNGVLDTFADVLHNNSQTAKFVNCVTVLAEGYMLFTNMAWKAFLDMGTLYMCSSTTTMEYDSEWLEFCQVIYHMFGAGVINALRGRGHFSQVTSEKTSKGKYKPMDGEFNFPIPSIPTLKKLDIGFPSEISVGFIEQILQLAQKKSEQGSQFILSFDGKLIAPGCKGEQNGDTNLWGVEGPPSLPLAVQILKRTLSVTVLAEGYMLFTNMAWKAFLDMGTLYMCSSTTTMEYDSEWLEFCQVIYHMFGAGVINALRGRGHFSQVTSEKTSKGKYKPMDGEFNFPIPSIPTLKKLDIGFPSEISVGFIEQILQLAQKKSEQGSQFILSFDGKLIAPGCKGEQNGDTNLWGVEGPPSLPLAVQILKRTLRTAEAIDVDMADTSVLPNYFNLKTLLNVSTRRIRRLRGRITGSFYLKKKLIDKCGNSQELQYKHRHRMSTLNQNTADCESVGRR